MRGLPRIAALGLAVAYAAALLTPCPPDAAARVAHEGHAHAVAPPGAAAHEAPPRLATPCPCGCDGGDPTAVLPVRLGWAEPAEEVRPQPPVGWTAVLIFEVRLPDAPDSDSDPVPI